MSREFPELEQIRLVVDDSVRERHLGVIAAEVRARRVPRFKRFRLLAVATALLLLLPVIALAADDSVPGDALYPVKRLFEPIVSLFDRDVEVDRRVEEVEILHEREVEADLIWQQIERARIVVTDPASDHAERLERVADELEGADGDARDSEATDTRKETDHRVPDESGDSSVDSDVQTRPSGQTTTTHAFSRTTRSGDRSGDR